MFLGTVKYSIVLQHIFTCVYSVTIYSVGHPCFYSFLEWGEKTRLEHTLNIVSYSLLIILVLTVGKIIICYTTDIASFPHKKWRGV